MANRVPLASLAPAARKKRIAVLAKNPGTRSAIPDKYLPAQYRAGRAQAQKIKTENATLYNPAAILSGPDLRSAVKSEVDLQLKPQIDAYDKNIKDLTFARDFSSKRLGQYFDLYDKSTAASAANLSSSGQALVQQLAAAGQQTQDQLGQIKSDISNEAAADTALRGPGLQDFSRANAAVDFNKAQAAGATSSAELAAGGALSGTNTLAGTIAAVAPMRARDQQFALAGKFNQQIADMTAKRAGVEASRGDLTASTLNKMRQDQFTNLATMKGLDIKESDLEETVRSHKATEKLTGKAIRQRDLASIRTARTSKEKAKADSAYRDAQIDIKRGIDPVTGKRLPKGPKSQADALNKWKLDFARKHGYLPSTGAGKKGSKGSSDEPSLTPNERVTQAQKYGPIHNVVSTSIKQDFPNDRHGAAKAFLADNPSADPLYVSVALDMAYDGHVSRANARKLHQRGLTVKDLGATSYQDWKKRGGRTPGPKGPIAQGKFPPINIPVRP